MTFRWLFDLGSVLITKMLHQQTTVLKLVAFDENIACDEHWACCGQWTVEKKTQ